MTIELFYKLMSNINISDDILLYNDSKHNININISYNKIQKFLRKLK